MYNINYHNNNIYGTYDTYYLNNAYSYPYDLYNELKTKQNFSILNGNNIFKYQTTTKYLTPLIIQPSKYNSDYNYKYVTKTPSLSPIKKSLINDFNNVKLISKSPEPYIRLNSNDYNTGNYVNSSDYNNNYNNSLINLRINNIKQVSRPIVLPQIPYYNPYEIKAKTPEPNLRGRKKLKKKHSKLKGKSDNYNIKTFIPLKQNLINNNYKLNNINYKNLNNIIPSPYENYHKLYSTPTNNYYYQINNYPTKLVINEINPNKIYNNRNTDLQNNNVRRNRFKDYCVKNIEPDKNFNSAEFILVNQIGEGSFGKIYCVQWIKNDKLYAMKKLKLKSLEKLKEFHGKVKIVKDLLKKTNHYGFVKIYGYKIVQVNSYELSYNYYIIMELGERDWEKEIKLRLVHQKYYSEYELFQIINQLVKTLSIMQKNKVSHRDVKPQNVLIMNGIYKICDFGEAMVFEGNGLVVQPVRGSQLFMSPILFYAYNHNISQVMHNTFKSDVFSLGMSVLLAANLSEYVLYDIRELVDIKAISKIINNKLQKRYSLQFINLILKMLQIDENLRMDFIQLELYLLNYWNNN